MTEPEWLATTDPTALLDYLEKNGTATERQLRLFVVACCRRADSLPDAETYAAVDTAERFADGQVSRDVLEAAGPVLREFYRTVAPHPLAVAAHIACNTLSVSEAGSAADAVVRGIASSAAREEHEDRDAVLKAVRRTEGSVQTALVRDIFNNPFRPLPPLGSAVLAWGDGLVVKLAQAAYNDRILPSGHLNPDRLAVLADALEEVDADASLVEHLRRPGPHVRGCVVVDLLTNRG
jgi:hypothetical protein